MMNARIHQGLIGGTDSPHSIRSFPAEHPEEVQKRVEARATSAEILPTVAQLIHLEKFIVMCM